MVEDLDKFVDLLPLSGHRRHNSIPCLGDAQCSQKGACWIDVAMFLLIVFSY